MGLLPLSTASLPASVTRVSRSPSIARCSMANTHCRFNRQPELCLEDWYTSTFAAFIQVSGSLCMSGGSSGCDLKAQPSIVTIDRAYSLVVSGRWRHESVMIVAADVRGITRLDFIVGAEMVALISTVGLVYAYNGWTASQWISQDQVSDVHEGGHGSALDLRRRRNATPCPT
jgi:hypothetical protein